MTADTIHEACRFYDDNYELLFGAVVNGTVRETLGNKMDRRCRFCDMTAPTVQFSTECHAIPESMGNNSLFVYHECDGCNQKFGSTIENDFGAWSLPFQTLMRIRSKRGLPSIKGANGGWTIRGDVGGLHVRQDRLISTEEILLIDEQERELRFAVRRRPYQPIGVLKTLVRIALTICPESEMVHFQRAIDWLNGNGSLIDPVKKLPLVRTLVPQAPDKIITVVLFRRRTPVVKFPFATLAITLGDEIYQVFVPCQGHDNLVDEDLEGFFRWPHPVELVSQRPVRSRNQWLSMWDNSKVYDELEEINMIYGSRTQVVNKVSM